MAETKIEAPTNTPTNTPTATPIILDDADYLIQYNGWYGGLAGAFGQKPTVRKSFYGLKP